MELTEREVVQMTQMVDEQHHESMHDLTERIHTVHAETSTFRRLAPAVATGTALAIGSTLLPFSRVAFAALDDATIAAFAQSVELAAVEAYKAAAGSGKVTTKAVVDAATMFMGHHAEHAAAFGAAAGDKKYDKPNPKLLAAVGDQLGKAADEKAILKIALDLENAAAATYMFALGALTSPAALSLTASILPVEAQHAVVLGSVIGADVAVYLPSFESAAAAVAPDQFPL